MTQQESINRFLTEYMGLCWHCEAPDPTVFNNKVRCIRCGELVPIENGCKFFAKNPNFFTPDGMVTLMRYMQKERPEEWDEFISLGPDVHISVTGNALCPAVIPIYLIDPDIFADRLAVFLGWKEKG